MRFAKETSMDWCLGHGDWLNVTLARDGETLTLERAVYGLLVGEREVKLTVEDIASLERVARGCRAVYARSACSMIAKRENYLRDVVVEKCDWRHAYA